jgi:cytochrome c-type biogenesis protein CcsB
MVLQRLLETLILFGLVALMGSYSRPKLGFYITVFLNWALIFLLGFRWLGFGYFPLSNLYESLHFLAWCITFVAIVSEKKGNPILIGSIVAPVLLLLLFFADFCLPSYLQEPTPLVPSLKSNWLMLHVSVMILSYGGLVVGSLLATFLLFLSRIWCCGYIETAELAVVDLLNLAFYFGREKKTELLYGMVCKYRSEMLFKIEYLSYQLIKFGFVLLTLGIISGAIWANEAWGSYWSWDPKETWALTTWFVFASYLHTRLVASRDKGKSAVVACLGFVVLCICYLGVNLLGKGLHVYGQIL